MSFYSSAVTTISVSEVVFALLCGTVGCNSVGGSQTQLPFLNGAPSAQPSDSIGDKDTYAVYDAILGGPSTGPTKEANNTVAIKDHTRTGISCSDLSTAVDPRLKAAGQDFAEQNSKERFLTPGIPTSASLET